MRHSSIFGRVSRAIVGSSLSAIILIAGMGFSTSAFANLGVAVNVPGPGSLPPAPYSNEIFPGDVTAFRISLTNDDPTNPLVGIGFTIPLPLNVRILDLKAFDCVAGDGSTSSQLSSGEVTFTTTSTNNIVLAGGSVPTALGGGHNGVCNIDVEVTTLAPNFVFSAALAAGAVTSTGGQTNPDPASASVTVDDIKLPVIRKAFSKSVIVKNDEIVTMSVTIDNGNNPNVDLPLNGVGDTPNFALRDSLPPQLQIAHTPNATATCTAGGAGPTNFSAPPDGTSIMIQGGTVAAGGSCTYTVDLVGVTNQSDPGKATAYSADAINTINASSDFHNRRGTVPTNDATARLTVNSILQVTKQFASPAGIAAGEHSSLAITLTNASPTQVIHMTSFSDSPIGMPAGLVLDGPLVVTGCGSATFAPVSTTGITLNGPGDLPAGAVCTITIPFKATLPTPGTSQVFSDAILAGAIVTTNPDIVSQPANHSVTVFDQLTVDKSSIPSNVAPGSSIQYTITVKNFSTAAATGVSVTDHLPNNIVALQLPSGPVAGGDAGCNLASPGIPAAPGTTATPVFVLDMPPGQVAAPATCTITFWAMSPPDGDSNATVGTITTNIIRAGDASNGTGPGKVHNGVDSGGAVATMTSGVGIGKVFNPGSASEGTVSVLTITLSNNTTRDVTNAAFSDQLPTAGAVVGAAQLMIASPADASTSCGGTLTAAPGTSLITLTGGKIPPRANNGTGAPGTCVVTVKVIGSAGSYTNEIRDAGNLTGLATYANGTSNHAITAPGPVGASASLTYQSALTAAKSFSPTTIVPGGTSTVRIELGNTGTGTLNGVAVTDPMPGGLTIAAPSNARTTCGGSPVFTAAPGSSSMAVTGIVLPAKALCDVLFDVVGAGNGNWTNTIDPGLISAAGGVKNTSSITATLNNSAGGSVLVTVGVSNGSLTAPGQSSVLTTRIRNTGTVPLTGLALNNFFTNTGLQGGVLTGMQLTSVPGIVLTNCTGAILTPGTDSASLSLSNLSLAPGVECVITANVTMVSAGTAIDLISVGAIHTNEGISNTLPTNTSLSTSAAIGVFKTFTPAIVKPGDRARLRLTFVNPLTISLTGLGAIDTLPGGMTVPVNANPFTNCTDASITATAGTVTVAGGSLPAAGTTAASCYVEIDVQVPAAGTYTNTIGVNQVTATSGTGTVHNTQPATAQLQVSLPATIAKVFNPRSVVPGAPSTVTITVSNPNTIALTGAVLTDPLPAGLTVAPGPDSTPTTPISPVTSTTCVGGVITATTAATKVILTGATIPANGSCTVTFQAQSNVAGIYVNTIPSGGLTTSEGVTNDTPATDTLSLLNPPTVNKQFSPVSIGSGGTSTMTIVLGNTNATAATLTSTLVDTLPTAPGNMVVASSIPTPLSTACPGTVTAVPGSGTVTYANGATIPAGGCTISVNVTATAEGSYNNFIPAGGLTTVIGNNVQPASANLVITPLGAISGKVFIDNNVAPDGLFNNPTGANPDVGAANITMTLIGTNYGANGVAGGGDDTAVSLTTTTDALGNYAFTGLENGSYTVTETMQPAGTVNGATTAGPINGSGTSGAASVPATPTSTISNITLSKTVTTVASSPNNNFAEIATSSLAGIVYLDQNHNGVNDVGDSALSGVTLELIPTGSTTPIMTTHTDANGAYSFAGVPPGNYFIREPVQPAGTINGVTTAGTTGHGGNAGTGTPSTTPISAVAGIVLPPGVNSVSNNFAELPSGRLIKGTVYLDNNNNGSFNAGDTGIAGVTLVLTGQDINGVPVPANTTTVTDANGNYIFMGLGAGTYVVTEPTQPPRTTNGPTNPSTGSSATGPAVTPSVISAINLTDPITISNSNNFGEIAIPSGTVSGVVYVDTNNNGIIDAGEQGINTTPGVTVTLTGTEADNTTPYTATLQTKPDGTYSFLGVPPSNAAGYTITELQPALYKDGKTTVAAGNPGTPSSAKPVLTNNIDVIRGVVVIAGDVLPNYNFGEIPLVGQGLIPPIVNGYVYLDKDHDHVRDNDGSAIGQAGWTVVLTNTTIAPNLTCTTTTDAAGFYQFDNLHCPGYEAGLPIGPGYKISFNKDGSTLPAVPTSGGSRGQVPGGGGIISNIELHAADQVVEQNLPLDPSGVIYDSSSRLPVPGATVTISGPPGFDPTSHLVGGRDTQTVGSDGYYEFLLQDNGTPFPNGTYTLVVTPPGAYSLSGILPACANTLVVGNAFLTSRIQASDNAPGQSVPQQLNPATCQGLVSGGANSTQYYFSFVIDHNSTAILNNHIPLDPMSSNAILVTKTSPLVNVSRGDLVPYTITATNTLSNPIANVAVRDQIPPGFKYRIGSASLNGMRLEPSVSGRVLTWPAQTFIAKEKKVYRLILQVGSGVGDGKYVNQGFAMNAASAFMLSNVATATVNVVPDPTFDCPDVIGKVFDDLNANGYQDQDEPGIPAVRLATARGLLVMTDAEGRFHVPCPEIPNPDRGSNFIMKLDTRTLPSGYRITTENPRDVRLTRGKVSKLNFGATIHRVVRLELSDSAFLPNSDTLQPQWQKQLDALPETLKLRPSVVRLNYESGSDSPDLVKQRIAAISKQIKGRWTALKGQYTLDIETEDAQ
jgi:uncharacterized repeat protein (TIGR01451 family)